MTGRPLLRRVLLVGLVAVAAVMAVGASSAAPAPAGPPAGTGSSGAAGSPVVGPDEAARIRDYWTPERMRQARPAP